MDDFRIVEVRSTFTAEQVEAVIRFTFMVSQLATASISLQPTDPRLGNILREVKRAEQDLLGLFLNDTERSRFEGIIKATSEAANKSRIIL